MFRKDRHREIARLLAALDAGLLQDCECWFAGGTAISMLLGEYRRSDDVDFLCSSSDGYRRLREEVFHRGLAALGADLPVVRDARADQYGIRCVLGTLDNPIKFEVVREARIDLSPGEDVIEGVALLSRPDLYAEKLLANADRGLDRAALFRDFIDLCMMSRAWPEVREAACAKAVAAYGDVVPSMLDKVAEEVGKGDHLAESLRRMDADGEVEGAVRGVLARNVRSTLAGPDPD